MPQQNIHQNENLCQVLPTKSVEWKFNSVTESDRETEIHIDG